ncbi:hypothetical protein [Nocardia jejuensis]|uniref:hypothetical protein n=1 Tax=Nocardia jejuensis TaxID=328049 RepID=UPI000829E471|nr:hypothetical protein [Nocardia jejuensis]
MSFLDLPPEIRAALLRPEGAGKPGPPVISGPPGQPDPADVAAMIFVDVEELGPSGSRVAATEWDARVMDFTDVEELDSIGGRARIVDPH